MGPDATILVILFSHKKGDNMPMRCPATRKEVETIIVSEVRQRKTSTIWYLLEVDSKNGYQWTSLQTEMGLQYSKAPYSYQKGKVVGIEKWAGGDELFFMK